MSGETKTCTRCKQERPLEQFRFSGRAKAGVRYRASDCRSCHALDVNARRQADLETHRARELAYSRAHAERKRENARRWYYANKERALAKANAAYARDPEYTRDQAHQSRGRKAGAPVVEFVRRRKVYERDGGICHVCSEKVEWKDFHVDHIVPLADGGEHSYANVKTSHARCNLARRYPKCHPSST